MKKIVLAGLIAASTAVMATEYSPFVGGEWITTELELDSGVKTGHEVAWGVRAGLAADNHRVYINYGQGETGSGVDVSGMGINLDGVTAPYKFTDYLATRFFVGGHIGSTEYDDTYDLAYGVQGGVLFDFTANLSLEAGARYSFSEVNGVDHAETFYGAVNFQF